jgi:hypothetical protein
MMAVCSPFAHCSMRPQGASRHTEHLRCSGTPSSSVRAWTRPLLAAVASLIALVGSEVSHSASSRCRQVLWPPAGHFEPHLVCATYSYSAPHTTTRAL